MHGLHPIQHDLHVGRTHHQRDVGPLICRHRQPAAPPPRAAWPVVRKLVVGPEIQAGCALATEDDPRVIRLDAVGLHPGHGCVRVRFDLQVVRQAKLRAPSARQRTAHLLVRNALVQRIHRNHARDRLGVRRAVALGHRQRHVDWTTHPKHRLDPTVRVGGKKLGLRIKGPLPRCACVVEHAVAIKDHRVESAEHLGRRRHRLGQGLHRPWDGRLPNAFALVSNADGAARVVCRTFEGCPVGRNACAGIRPSARLVVKPVHALAREQGDSTPAQRQQLSIGFTRPHRVSQVGPTGPAGGRAIHRRASRLHGVDVVGVHGIYRDFHASPIGGQTGRQLPPRRAVVRGSEQLARVARPRHHVPTARIVEALLNFVNRPT